MTENNNRGGRRFGGYFRSNRGEYDRGERFRGDGERADRSWDRPYGDKRSDKKPYGEKPYGEKRFDKKPYGEKPYGEKPYGEKRFDKKPYGEKQFGERPYGEKRFDKKPYGEKQFGEKPFGEKRFDKKPYGEKQFGEKPYGEKRFDRKPYGDKPFDKKPYGEKPFDKKPYGEKPFDRKPYGEKPYGEKPYGEKRFDKKPYGDRPYGEKPYGEKNFEGRRHFEDDRRFDEGRRFEAKPEPAPEQPAELPNIIIGRNPVREAIKSGRSIDRILVTKEHDGSLGEIVSMARDRNLVIREVDRHKLDELCMPFGHDGKPGNHQGVAAEIPGVEYCELSDILAYAEEKGEKPFVVLLDGIEDPHNLGSVIRSAECAGAHGVVIPKRRSSPVTAAVVKTSAGAAEHMRIARVVNIVAAMERLKEEGLWIAGADMAGKSMYDTDMKGGFALVIGGEGDGLSKLVREKCDFLVSIPLKGSIDSLNAAVAAAIIMFEKNRQDAAN